MARTFIGVGGWTYEPWRGSFYPDGLAQSRELEYAASHLTGIEINATYYRLQKPESFAKWRDAAPDGFRFTVKASRYATNRKDLREAESAIAKFVAQGLGELGDKLGPLLWQFAPTKRFDADEFDAFMGLLPDEVDDLPLRHALEVRHESFACAEFVDLARRHGVAIAIAAHNEYPRIADLTADFVYVRMMQTEERLNTGYAEGALDEWATRIAAWRGGQAPGGLHYVSAEAAPAQPRDVYAFVISGAKVRNPAAAMALIERVSR